MTQYFHNVSSFSSLEIIQYINEKRVLFEIDDIISKFEIIEPLTSNKIGLNLLQTLTNILDCCGDELKNEMQESIRMNLKRLCSKISLKEEGFQFSSQQVAVLIHARKDLIEAHRLTYRIKTVAQNQMRIMDSVRSYNNYTDNVVELPIASIIDDLSSSEKHSLSRLSVIAYKDDKLFRSGIEFNIVSKVMYVHISGVSVQNLKEDINLTFAHAQGNTPNRQLSCVYWNQYRDNFSSWDQHGCRVLETSRDYVTCGCNHLSSFALMMSIEQSEVHNKLQEVMSVVGCSISILSLFATLLTYWMFPFLRLDIPSKILMHLCSSLLVANVAFIVNVSIEYSNAVKKVIWICRSVAMLLHYSMLSALLWMACDAYYLYVAMTRVFITFANRLLLLFKIIGWGLPLLIVLLTAIHNSLNNYTIENSSVCWIKRPVAYFVFVAPAGFIMIFNLVNFAIVIHFLRRASSTQLSPDMKKEIVIQLKGALSLASLLGLTWVFGFLAIWLSPVVFSYLFVVFNTLQGFFIFVFYCVLKPNVSYFWTRCLRGWLPSKKIIAEDTTRGLTDMRQSTTTTIVVGERESKIQENEEIDREKIVTAKPVSCSHISNSYFQPNIESKRNHPSRPWSIFGNVLFRRDTVDSNVDDGKHS